MVCYNCSAEPAFSITVDPSFQSVCAPDTVEFTVVVGQIMGYVEPVTLSAETESGVTAEFSETEVIPPATVTLTLTVNDSAEETIHIVGILGEASDGMTQESSVQVGVSSSLPLSVTLSQPYNGETEIPIIPTFVWVEGAGVHSWKFQLLVG